MGQNYWAVIFPEPDAPGVWGTWVREDCVAIGWPPSRFQLHGKAHDHAWATLRRRAQQIKPGDIVIPYLMDHRFGIPCVVRSVAIKDDEWNPAVPKGEASGNRFELGLGRRIDVEWLKQAVPPLDKIAVMPKSMQKPRGEVRATIEPVRPERYARFMKIISDTKNWKRYRIEKVRVPMQTGIESTGEGDPSLASFLAGNRPYLERAREAFPILVRQAHARQKIFYSNLADELKMPNPRNLNYVLGAIGKAIQQLATNWKQEIPPLQCLVVNKGDGMPGEGVGWFTTDLKDFGKRTAEEKRQILGIELVKVFNYAKWEAVLCAFGLSPLSTDPAIAGLKAKACRMGGIGEHEDHKNLIYYIANNPEVVGLSNSKIGDTEYCFPSADRIDVVFHDKNNGQWLGVEVNGPSSPDADIASRLLKNCVEQ